MKNYIIFLLTLLIVTSINHSAFSKGIVQNTQGKNKLHYPLSDINKKYNFIQKLPIGEISILSLSEPIVITPEGENNKHIETIYSLNRYYDGHPFKTYKKNEISTDEKRISDHTGVLYYDAEISSNHIQVNKNSRKIVNRLPSIHNLAIFMTELDIDTKLNYQKDSVLTLITYSIKSKEIIDSLNIYYNINLSYNERESFQKNFTNGFIKKLFYINKKHIIDIFYIDYVYQGEAEEYRFLKNEQWQIKPNGKFVRHYNKDGNFNNIDEKGMIKNTMREGKWIEIKPNGIANQTTYLEAEFQKGEPAGNLKYYAYENFKKGKLLYIETYQNGTLQKRTFID